MGWLQRHTWSIIVGSLALVALSTYLVAFHLPLRADFSYLLPQEAPAVRDLRRLEARVKSGDTVLVLLEAPTAEIRAAAAPPLVAGLRALPKELVDAVDFDDSAARAFFKAHRHLFIPLPDLQKGYATLKQTIDRAKLAANPAFIDLDDEPDPAAEAKRKAELEDLQAKRKQYEAKLDHPSNISADGRMMLIQLRTPFRSTDATRGRRLMDGIARVRASVVAAYPGVVVGVTGSVITAVAEHDAIFQGMVLSSALTMGLVALLLAFYFRSATLLGMLVGTLSVASVIAFGFAAITVGHLNAASAFLGAIIAGNGINYGILLIARYLEERRLHEAPDAMAHAIAGTLRPTAIASLGASIAYGSLAVTSFRGFADFATIGAIGMLVFWVVTYTLLPAAVLRWGTRTRIHAGTPIVGSALVRVLGFRRSGVVCAVALLGAIASSVIVYRYVAADPFEYDIKRLRSEGDAAVEARHWMATSDRNFGRGLSGRTYIAADRPEQVPLIVDALRARNAGVPVEQQTIGSIASMLDAIPPQQPEKLVLLDELRTLIDANAEALPDDQRAEILALRPPDGLRAIEATDLPDLVKSQLVEKDGRMGLLISVRPAEHLDEWDGHALIQFANAVRTLQLADRETVTTSGGSVVFADIVDSIERDGPKVTGVAAAALILMVLLLVGRNRRAAAVLLGTAAGTVLMVAVCALLGLKVNFLDFIALPITLGLGIDYAINIAHRHDTEEVPDPITTLRTSGSAVFVCSLTTIIGYGSLLASDNLAIRGFGTASLIGEITCVFTALVLVPAIMAVGRPRPSSLPDARIITSR